MTDTVLQKIVAATGNETVDKAQEIVTEITQAKVIKALLLVLAAYLILFFIDKVINWLSEQVPLLFRLKVKQSLPFWRAFCLSFFGFLICNLFLDLSPNNVLAVTGTVAVALGFAFKDYVSSVIAGIIGLFENPYQVGDRVKIKEYYGEIISYGIRGIRLQTPDDNIVSIPHNQIWTEAISNANKGAVEAQTVAEFYFAHNIDVEAVMKILYRVAQTSKYTQLKLPILVIMDEKPWGTHFKLKSYPIDARDEFIYQTDLVKRAKQAFAKQDFSYPVLPPQPIDPSGLPTSESLPR
ncbi:mechanosensitive ion channel family protein [Oscillatoriales cyanobacterium LEGE 11467]|uniref:Mechanosensitive ion channel family protein n=1 Tax=Zarconia navalis LEGE 11467 TaxID=1828826 RepID=A0A928VYB0_9CYAN|nr:mechanosensitive ion channel family protein [Zarconia navalis]MBE9042351.1 mechanosensitive ion channel family protein [Zarconia navalis LEGE 11467]